MKYKEIAVIGMSGRFAKANNIEEYRALMKNKESAIGLPSSERLDLMKQNAEKDYMKLGYMENIDRFDNEFFDVSAREARLMSPEQRLSLELVADAILDAGYSIEQFKGTNCGVFVAEGDSEYHRYVTRPSSTSIIGSKNFMLSGQIGYHFDLRGENLSINSGCSSSVLAVHYACEKLTLGEIDAAIVGGITLEVKAPEAKKNQYDVLGIMSEDYTIRSFDEAANGTVSGEGGGFLVLKSLEQAEQDGDHIYGVLVAGAVNGDGGRCANVSMPSVEAQGDVVLKAWKDVDITRLTEIEAHGIGAPIGDAVEAQSLIDAVKKCELVDNHVKISTVKSNIGHLFPLSGIASLVKVLTGYAHQESYPIATLENLNPLIHFDEAGLEPVRQVYHWDEDAERMTGISAFGLNGCNAHIVVRNYVPKQEMPPQAFSLMKLSARSETAFEQMKQRVLAYLNTNPDALNGLVYTMNTGRDDYDYRAVIEAKSLASYKNALTQAKPMFVEKKEYKVIFAIKTEEQADFDLQEYESILPNVEQGASTGLKGVDEKLALYRALAEVGIKSKTLLIDKICATGLKFQNGECSVEELDAVIRETDINTDYSGCFAQIQKKNTGKPLIVVDFSQTKALASLNEVENIQVFCVHDPLELAALIRLWYEADLGLQWENLYGKCPQRKISAPSYPFDRQHFWIEVEAEAPTVTATSTNVSATPVTQAVAQTAPLLPEKKIFIMQKESLQRVDVHSYPYTNTAFRALFQPETADISADFQLAMYRHVKKLGIKPDAILADKAGKAICKYEKNQISVGRLREVVSDESENRQEKIVQELQKLAQSYTLTIFDFRQHGDLKAVPWQGVVRVIAMAEEADLQGYLNNPEPQPIAVTPPVSQPVLQIPVAEPVKEQAAEPVAETTTNQKTAEVVEAENFLETVWSKAFNLDGEIGHDEDFFALGGNSLIMQAMSDDINNHFKMKFDIFEIYDYETIEKLAVKILESAS